VLLCSAVMHRPRTTGVGRAALAAAVAVAAAGLGARALAERRDQSLAVSIWRAAGPAAPALGGRGYGGAAAPAPGGSFVTHRRDVVIGDDHVIRFPGVASGIDPATVEVRSVTDPGGTAVVEQRFVNDLVNAEALLFRQVGRPVTVTLTSGRVEGTLRAVASDSLVVETKTGLEIVRRGDQVVDIALGATTGDHEPTLVWKVSARRAGRHTVEVSYRTAGLSWQPDYTAVIGDGDHVDLTAWATVQNDTDLDLVGADLTLVDQPPSRPRGAAAGAGPVHFKIDRPADLPSGQSMQVELAPRRSAIKARRVVVFEAMSDQSASYTAYPAQDCYAYVPPGAGARAEEMLEIDGPGKTLPEGRLRVFRRQRDDLVVVGDDTLRVNATSGQLRVRAGTSPDITGERRQVDCRQDGGGRSLRERIEIKVDNKGKAAADVLVRDYMYRWANWRIDQEDVKGVKASASAQEYRVRIPAGGSKTVAYTVVYAW